ncbi:hypothetical protein AAHC03_020817 [Spirometra sp. Aus1]
MTDAGFFKGTSADQDSRFADKKKKLLKSMEFGDNLNKKRITELLTYEDDILCDYVFNQLSEQHPDPKEIQINMTGFLLSKNARIFISELWDLLLSAMGTPGGVPAVFLEAKKAELSQKQEEEAKMRSSFARTDSDQKRPPNQDPQRTAARTDFPKAGSPAAAATTADGIQDRQSPGRVRRRQKYSTSSADERSRSRSLPRSPTPRGRRSADHDDERRHRPRRHAYGSSRRSSSGDSRGRRHRRRHRHRERGSEEDEEERDFRRRSNRGRREAELVERSRRHRHYSEEDDSPDDRRSRRRRERDRLEKQGSDDHRPLSPRRPPEGPICVPQDSPLHPPAAVASPAHSASPVADKPSPVEEEQEQEIVALPPPPKRRRSGSVRGRSDEDAKSRHRDDSPSPPHRQGRSSRRPVEDSDHEERAVYPSDRHRREDREREAVRMESPPPAPRHQRRSRSRDGDERSRRRDRDGIENADYRKSIAADYAYRYQNRMENGGTGERSRRARIRDDYEHRLQEDERPGEAKRRSRRHEAESFRRSTRSPEGPSLPPQLEARHVSPEGPELPPTLQSVVRPVASAGRTGPSRKKPSRRSVSSENDSTSASSDKAPRKRRPSESRRLPARSRRTTEEVERKPRPPKTVNTVSSADAKARQKQQKADEVVPEGPALPPASPKRRHAIAAGDKRRRDSQKTRDDSYRRRHEENSDRHQVDRKSTSRSHGEAGRSPRNSSSTEDVLRQRALESLLKRKKSTEVH